MGSLQANSHTLAAAMCAAQHIVIVCVRVHPRRMVCNNNEWWKNVPFYSGWHQAVGQPTHSEDTNPSDCHHELRCFLSGPAGQAIGGRGDRWLVAEGVKKKTQTFTNGSYQFLVLQ